MPGFYNIYIIDPLKEVTEFMAVAKLLSDWFDPIVKTAQGTKYDYSFVQFPQYVVSPQPHELIIYVCAYEHSVLQHMPGANSKTFPNPATSSHKGVTVNGQPTASEIYVKNSNADLIAALIFHEAMHNKLQMTDAQLHNGFSGCSLSCGMIRAPASPSSAESKAMSAALNNSVPQWADGQEYLRYAASQRTKGDFEWDSRLKILRG